MSGRTFVHSPPSCFSRPFSPVSLESDIAIWDSSTVAFRRTLLLSIVV